MPIAKSKTKARKTTAKTNTVLLRRNKTGEITEVFLNGTLLKFLTDLHVEVPEINGAAYRVNLSLLADVTIQEKSNGKN